jgi:hypothetical protein
LKLWLSYNLILLAKRYWGFTEIYKEIKANNKKRGDQELETYPQGIIGLKQITYSYPTK